ncbi:hypothetical protein C2845_PM12G03350 [Panicum miliaceum]|uniref:Uncharacterized protein n=1 Tax=Panicum miliaceum TaxID=4540 RepID=A0A3L6QJL5_PANMI|nr:hypothetical protein C2845_PM12G03350 [Panicum miliaceum]
MPPQSAANTWVRFLNNAKACINHYNKKYQAGNVSKPSRRRCSTNFQLGEQQAWMKSVATGVIQR